MTKPSKTKLASEVRPENPTVALVWAMADTTWRMVLPPSALVAAGLYLDLRWQTKPWLTLIGAALGLVGGAMLVRRQLERAVD